QTASSPVYSAPPRTPIPPLSLHDALPIYPLGRTVTGTDNAWFTLLTQNTAPIHFDHHYAAQTSFGRPLVNSCLTLALVTGQSVRSEGTRLNSSHLVISYAVFCLIKKSKVG